MRVRLCRLSIFFPLKMSADDANGQQLGARIPACALQNPRGSGSLSLSGFARESSVKGALCRVIVMSSSVSARVTYLIGASLSSFPKRDQSSEDVSLDAADPVGSLSAKLPGGYKYEVLLDGKEVRAGSRIEQASGSQLKFTVRVAARSGSGADGGDSGQAASSGAAAGPSTDDTADRKNRKPGETALELMSQAVKDVQWGKLNSLRMRVEKRQVDVNQRDSQSCSLLHWAAINGRIDIVKYLLEKGAEVNRTGGILKETPLMWASRQGHLDVVILLHEAGADLNVRSAEGLDALQLACQYQKFALTMYLLSCGCSPNVRDNKGLTPLARVCRLQSQDYKMAKLLLTLGAKETIDSPHRQTGNTALHWAIEGSDSYDRGKLRTIRALLDAGASLDSENVDGQTPLQTAEKMGTGLHSDLQIYLSQKDKFMQGFFHPFLFGSGALFAASFLSWYVFVLVVAAVGYFSVGSRARYGHFMHRHILRSRTSLVPLGIASALIFFISGMYVYCLISRQYVAQLIVAVALIGAAVFTFFKAIVTDPGYTDRIDVTDNIASDAVKAGRVKALSRRVAHGFSLKVCPTCIAEMPPRSKHDPISDRCVQLFDHYCPFINNCVGKNNHSYFVAFLICVIAAIFNFVGVAFEFLTFSCGNQGLLATTGCAISEHLPQTLILVASLIVIVPVSFLLSFQSWLIANNVTSEEYTRKFSTYSRRKWLCTTVPEANEAWQNCKEFWQRGGLLQLNFAQEV